MSQFQVLRIGHRPERDKRITTHVALTSRAFGAYRMYLSKPDSRVIKTIDDVVSKFGGDFEVEPLSNPRKFAKNWEGRLVHLTMFGLPFEDFEDKLKEEQSPLLFIVGAGKVPRWAFEYADYNISIGNQPHSEIAALSITLSRINQNYVSQEFEGPLQVIPSSDHRKMIDTSR
ncbi:MAG TPA: tRNA (cytidine(56)-2'-O)-methyltransferase [Candidatus Poseidoniales archaeon]|jgi:tRNA (cytidine56-2'-O)-methyltransferase|nr:tRNA (cytidine(56)-2'-O)-methyltransferase [Candidatus Poseidoniales archaeon]